MTALAGKRRIVECTHVNYADRKGLPLKKVCTGKCAAVLDTIAFTRGVKSVVANSDKDTVSDVQF